jgi:pimeloyl-ACP methyl ester carboxylesterase
VGDTSRRNFLGGMTAGLVAWLGLGTSGRASADATSQAGRQPATYLLLHGAWHGAWCWQRVTPLLQQAGHAVHTPTLTGLGERVHLAHAGVDLDTHIQDVLSVLEYEDLSNVVLVGHSYGGMVITGVAERAPERLAQLVYLDAFVPRDGQALADLVGPEGGAQMRARAETLAENWQDPPFPVRAFGVTAEADVAWVGAKLGPQPLMTFIQPVRVASAAAAALPRSFIYCSSPAMGQFEQFLPRVRAEGWRFHELATGHDAMVTTPRELADVLLALI